MDTILLYNNALNLSLKQAMNDVNDVLYNMQSLKQFQWSIDQIQRMKDGAQMQVNMAALALWRNFVLNEGDNGLWLLRNLVRKYYPLKDEQIPKYEIYYSPYGKHYNITNMQVIKRKGEYFSLGNGRYGVDSTFSRNPNERRDISLRDLYYDAMSLDEVSYWGNWPFYVYQYSYYIDFLLVPVGRHGNFLAQNKFTNWSWSLVQSLTGCYQIDLLQNDGFFAQMGINNIKETLEHLQEIFGDSITEEMKNKTMARLKQKGIALYSYLPINKEFILQHQNELDWKIMQKNPHIQWDWELINLYLRKVKETVSEATRFEHLLGSKAMYAAVENYLNDEILADIEKLYQF